MLKQHWCKQATDRSLTVHEETISIHTSDLRRYQGDQLDWLDDTMVLKVPKHMRWVKIDTYLPQRITTLVLYRTWKGNRRGAWNRRLVACWTQ